MRRGQIAPGARIRAAPARKDVPVDIANADLRHARLRPGTTGQAVRTLLPGQLADVHPLVGVDIEVRWALNVGPGLEELAARAKDLNAVVLAVAHKHPSVAVGPHTVWQLELARPAAWLAPRLQVLAARGEAVYAGVAVTVGDVQLAARRDREPGWSIERPTAVRN